MRVNHFVPYVQHSLVYIPTFHLIIIQEIYIDEAIRRL